MSLLDKWGVSQKADPAIAATSAIPGREPAIHGANVGVSATPGIANPLRPLATPGATGRIPKGSDPRNRKRSQTNRDSWNCGNSRILGQNANGPQQSQESHEVDSCTLSIPVPPTEDAETVATIAEIAAPRSQHFPIDSLPAYLKTTFEERAAIVEADGGLDRSAAERLAWAEVVDGPPGDDAAAWQAWVEAWHQVQLLRGWSLIDALSLTWGHAEDAWHRRHGALPHSDRCAGCGAWMLDGPCVRLPDGAVIHFSGEYGLDCQIVYGAQWRGEAHAALIALGVTTSSEVPL